MSEITIPELPAPDSAQWLVRTVSNMIRGPFTPAQIRELIETAQIQPQDELCEGNSYWFFAQENDEIFKRLGFEVTLAPVTHPDDEETQTDTKVLTPKTPYEMPIPELPDSTDSGRSPKRPLIIHAPQIFGAIERRSIWSIIGVTLLILILISLLGILRLVRL